MTTQVNCDRCGKEVTERYSMYDNAKHISISVTCLSVEAPGRRRIDLCLSCQKGLDDIVAKYVPSAFK